MLIIKHLAGYMVVATTILSCAKSDSYDIKGEAEVKFFTNNAGAGNMPENSIGYNIVNIPDVAAGSGWQNLSSTLSEAVKFPVLATRAVSKDVAIGATLDNSLIDAYNASHNTNYKPFPAGVLNANDLVAHMLKGETKSTDSITITPDLNALKTLTETVYMAPIKLTTVSDPFVGKVSDNKTIQVTYIVVNVELRRIKYLAVAADALGALVTPRSSWAITFNPAPTTTSGSGSVLDGSTSSYSRWTASPVQVDVNLQTTKNVTGVRLYTTTSATNIPTQVEVSLSSDGINYDVIGAPLRANLTYASSYNYILFYKAITAKYLRLKLYYSTSTSTNNYRLAELDVYAN